MRPLSQIDRYLPSTAGASSVPANELSKCMVARSSPFRRASLFLFVSKSSSFKKNVRDGIGATDMCALRGKHGRGGGRTLTSSFPNDILAILSYHLAKLLANCHTTKQQLTIFTGKPPASSSKALSDRPHRDKTVKTVPNSATCSKHFPPPNMIHRPTFSLHIDISSIRFLHRAWVH